MAAHLLAYYWLLPWTFNSGIAHMSQALNLYEASPVSAPLRDFPQVKDQEAVKELLHGAALGGGGA
jgi:hypothetical protein